MARPVVDRIERELGDEAEVIRLSVMSAAGREAALRYGVRAVPTLLVIDACGDVVETQVGVLVAQRAVEAARAAAATCADAVQP